MLTPGLTRISALGGDSEKDSTQIRRNRRVRPDLRAISENLARRALSAITRPRVVQRIKSTPHPPRSERALALEVDR